MKKKHLLVGSKGCGSAIVECAFAVAGIGFDYEEVDYGAGSATRARLVELNPLAQVPALVLPGGEVMTESLAMVQHLHDLAPKAGLLPAPGDPARTGYLRWSTFLVAAIYPTFTYGDEPAKWVEEPRGAKQLRESTDRHRLALWQRLEEAARAPWFLGESFSAIDLYLAVMTHWRPGRKWFAANTPALHAIAEKTSATPGVADVIRRNFA
ncbi:MAG TPA: glutathione S-transferase family protein [Usitatibacter sp.]|nr:glutathione S-transferase family protein [Usitatibacter sp.]